MMDMANVAKGGGSLFVEASPLHPPKGGTNFHRDVSALKTSRLKGPRCVLGSVLKEKPDEEPPALFCEGRFPEPGKGFGVLCLVVPNRKRQLLD